MPPVKQEKRCSQVVFVIRGVKSIFFKKSFLIDIYGLVFIHVNSQGLISSRVRKLFEGLKSRIQVRLKYHFLLFFMYPNTEKEATKKTSKSRE